MKTIAKLTPTATVKGAYDLKMQPEALQQLEKIKEYSDYAQEQAQLASKVTVTDDESNAKAADLLVNLTKARKGLEELQKYFTGPLEASKKTVIGVFKKILGDPQGQEERLRREIEAYFEKKEAARLEAEAEKKRQADAAAAKARSLGRSAPKPVATAAAPETARAVATENGSAGISMYWDYELVDLKQVPEQFIIRELNKKAVAAAIDAGVREIPGLTIKQKPRVAVR